MNNSARSQLIHINSSNRTSGTIHDFTIDLGNRLFALDDARGRIRVCPTQLVINRSWYTVADSINDRFDLFDGTTLTTVVLPSGYYNYKNFMTALQNLLPGWLVEWSILLAKYKVTPPNDTKTYTLYFTTPAAELMGFSLGDEKVTSFETPLFSDRPIRMNRETVVLVHASFAKERFAAVDNVLTTTMKESDIFIKAPVEKAPFDNLVWRVQHLDINSFYLSTTSLSSVRFYLTDEYDRPLVPAYDWTMSIRVDHEPRDKLDMMQSSIDRIRDYIRYLVLQPMPSSDRDPKKYLGTNVNNNKSRPHRKN